MALDSVEGLALLTSQQRNYVCFLPACGCGSGTTLFLGPEVALLWLPFLSFIFAMKRPYFSQYVIVAQLSLDKTVLYSFKIHKGGFSTNRQRVRDSPCGQTKQQNSIYRALVNHFILKVAVWLNWWQADLSNAILLGSFMTVLATIIACLERLSQQIAFPQLSLSSCFSTETFK